MNRISSIFIHLPIQLVTVWVDDFPNFPFGGISICSLEGIFQNLGLTYWSNIKWKAELLNGSSSKSQATKTLEDRKCFWCWGVEVLILLDFGGLKTKSQHRHGCGSWKKSWEVGIQPPIFRYLPRKIPPAAGELNCLRFPWWDSVGRYRKIHPWNRRNINATHQLLGSMLGFRGV